MLGDKDKDTGLYYTTANAAVGMVGSMNTKECAEAYGALKPHHDIGWAVKQMHNGSLVRRRGWNGHGMHLALQVPDANSKMTLPYVYMKTAQGALVPWLCSQTDLLALDWEFAEI